MEIMYIRRIFVQSVKDPGFEEDLTPIGIGGGAAHLEWGCKPWVFPSLEKCFVSKDSQWL